MFLKPGLSRLLYARYFLVNLLLFTFLISHLIEFIYRKKRIGKPICIILLSLFLLGHSIYLYSFLKYGRGQFKQAIEYIADISKGQKATIGSNHDLRNSLLVNFYLSRVKDTENLRYLKGTQWEGENPTYYLYHKIGSYFNPPEIIKSEEELYTFKFLKSFRYSSGPSGWHWYLYQQIK